MLLISAPYYPPLNKHCLVCPSAGIPSYRFKYAKPSSPSRKKQEAREVCVCSKPGDVFQGMADDEWRDGGESDCRMQEPANTKFPAYGRSGLGGLLVEKNVRWGVGILGGRYSHEDSREAKFMGGSEDGEPVF